MKGFKTSSSIYFAEGLHNVRKSKQQVARDKFALKPQKGSVALREELRGKSSGVKGQQNKNVVSPS